MGGTAEKLAPLGHSEPLPERASDLDLIECVTIPRSDEVGTHGHNHAILHLLVESGACRMSCDCRCQCSGTSATIAVHQFHHIDLEDRLETGPLCKTAKLDPIGTGHAPEEGLSI